MKDKGGPAWLVGSLDIKGLEPLHCFREYSLGMSVNKGEEGSHFCHRLYDVKRVVLALKRAVVRNETKVL